MEHYFLTELKNFYRIEFCISKNMLHYLSISSQLTDSAVLKGTVKNKILNYSVPLK